MTDLNPFASLKVAPIPAATVRALTLDGMTLQWWGSAESGSEWYIGTDQRLYLVVFDLSGRPSHWQRLHDGESGVWPAEEEPAALYELPAEL